VQHGLSALENRRLKPSTIKDLNDPFDLVAIDITQPEVERAVQAHVDHFWQSNGVLCFSRNWDSLLL
jgi:hypothetical protein